MRTICGCCKEEYPNLDEAKRCCPSRKVGRTRVHHYLGHAAILCNTRGWQFASSDWEDVNCRQCRADQHYLGLLTLMDVEKLSLTREIIVIDADGRVRRG
ncbi:hypothetical protein LCGC14_1256960 [marine sediment metagenome]|uniref:Uncharacterized protein n=1 Tax=marine sediment metagenome TaxID=412755 RepID=A0A0F9L1P2_9ZZZZ